MRLDDSGSGAPSAGRAPARGDAAVRRRAWTLAGVFALFGMALGGCAGAYGYTEVSSAPYDLSVYPSAYYGGRTVYLIDNRWMYPDAGGWYYYPSEPSYLYTQRTYVYGGRPYRYGPGYGPTYTPNYTAPEARSRPYVQQAPPAGPAAPPGPSMRAAPPAAEPAIRSAPSTPASPRITGPSAPMRMQGPSRGPRR